LGRFLFESFGACVREYSADAETTAETTGAVGKASRGRRERPAIDICFRSRNLLEKTPG
jgi:hypothetical protein